MAKSRKFKTDKTLNVCMNRVGDAEYSERNRIKDLFEIATGKRDTCGNVRVNFTEDGRAVLMNVGGADNSLTRDYEQISSPLALYRTISMFECGIDTQYCDYYKMNWSIALKHKETGAILCLGEWKGGFQIFTQAADVRQLPRPFIRDAEALLTFLVSTKFPIGYGGTIAGTVA